MSGRVELEWTTLHKQSHIELTGSVVLIGEVGAILRARSKEAPECATTLAAAKAFEVDMAWEVALLKGLGEVLMVDVVAKEIAQENGEVNMTIWV